jgi:hypothetical protein
MRRWRLSAVVYTSKSSNYGCGNDVPLKQDRATPKQTLRVKESSLENVPSCETSGRRAARIIRDWLACLGLIKSGAAACTPARQLRNHVLADTRLYHHTPAAKARHMFTVRLLQLPGTFLHQRCGCHLFPAPDYDYLFLVHYVLSHTSLILSYSARCSTRLLPTENNEDLENTRRELFEAVLVSARR